MNREWHQYRFIHELSVEAAFEELDHEIVVAAANCPADASGALVRLAIEAKREVLDRIRERLDKEFQSLRTVLGDYGVWEEHADQD